MKRFLLAQVQHETNTFSPIPTTLTDFMNGPDGTLLSGNEAIASFIGTNTAINAFYDIAQEEGAEVVIPINAFAMPSGKVTDEAFEAISDLLIEAVESGVDAAFLSLHGAMVSDSYDDGEGELLRRIRDAAPELPIALALDFHTNLTPTMVESVNTIAGYCTYPHVDVYQTGMRAGRALVESLKHGSLPIISWRKLPMITHMLKQTPAEQPMKDIMDRAMGAESSGQVQLASVFGGFPLADIPHVSLSAAVVCDAEEAEAGDNLLDELMDQAWQRRADFVFQSPPMQESIAQAKAAQEFPVVLADHGDNCGAGGVTDVMAVLEQVIAQGLEDVAAGPFFDPEAVSLMVEAGVGTTLTLDVGGKTDMPAMKLKGKPLRLTGKVRMISDGRFKITGPVFTGTMADIGRTAVLDTGQALVVVCEKPIESFDLGIFTSVGIDPSRKKYLLIKSRQHFRGAFEPIAGTVIMVAGPGVCASEYDLFPFERLRRPIYPIDPNMQLEKETV